jgi:hypothetical protein
MLYAKFCATNAKTTSQTQCVGAFRSLPCVSHAGETPSVKTSLLEVSGVDGEQELDGGQKFDFLPKPVLSPTTLDTSGRFLISGLGNITCINACDRKDYLVRQGIPTPKSTRKAFKIQNTIILHRPSKPTTRSKVVFIIHFLIPYFLFLTSSSTSRISNFEYSSEFLLPSVRFTVESRNRKPIPLCRSLGIFTTNFHP